MSIRQALSQQASRVRTPSADATAMLLATDVTG